MSAFPVTGFIGTGSMGGAIAGTLLRRGFPLHVHDIRPEAVKGLAEDGATVSPDPETLAAACDVVLLSLPSHLEVEEVCFGSQGVLEARRPPQLLINLTTGSASKLLPRLAETERTHGIHYVTAPVSQGVDNAERGKLSVFTHGTELALQQARPVLEAFSERIFTLSSHRAAMAAKLITNLSWYVNAALLGDLMALSVRSGIQPGQIQGVLAGSCGTSWVIEHDIPSVLHGDYDPSFTLRLALKDLRLIIEMADELGIPSEMAMLAQAIFQRSALVYGTGAPELMPVRLTEQLTGAQVGPLPPVPLTASRRPDHPRLPADLAAGRTA